MIKASIISIGTELLNGRTVNSNATYMGKQLTEIGVETIRCLMIPDKKNDIISSIEFCKKDSEIVLLSGGLGPTNDDITKFVLNDYFGGKLIVNTSELKRLEELFSSRNIHFSEVNKMQASYPDVCDIMINLRGTASGMHFEKEGTHFYCTPGVPHEMLHLIEEKIIPHIKENLVISNELKTLTFRCCSYSESQMFMDIEDLINQNPDLDFAFYPHFLLVDLKVRGSRKSLDIVEVELDKRLNQKMYGRNEQISLEETVGILLRKKSFYLSTAESCTGGLIANKITQISGSSDYFKGSIVSYSNDIKMSELNVSEKILNSVGAVSSECVEQMAKTVKEKFSTNFSVSVSGIAGPNGGSEDKPVGTVWFGISSPTETKTITKNLGKGRVAVQERAATFALWLLYNELIKH